VVDTVKTHHEGVPRKLELSGITLAGRYVIERQLARGGMGAVYRATDVETGRACAVKVLRAELHTSEEMAHRFRRETQVVSSLGHPNVVSVYDSGVTPDGAPYFVMEFLEGRDLGALLEAQGRLPWRRAFGIAEQICSALQAAHEAEILHRDVKPENFFMVSEAGADSEHDDFVKVLDFGIAKRTAREGSMITKVGMFVGTPEYMSPEQARGDDLDARVDVYGLGVLLYHLVLGKVPFRGRDEFDVLTQHAKLLPEPPTLADASLELPPDAEHVILRALEKDPFDRYPSMAELGAALRQVLDAHTRPATSSSRTRLPKPEPEPSSPWGAVVAGLALGVAILAVAGLLLFG
jgi:serine/threonine-protein kinase